MEKERLDLVLVERRLLRSRSQARDAIKRGKVRVEGVIITKPSQLISKQALIKLSGHEAHYVSRGALKLKAALEAFGFEVAGRTCLDIGASTGGFTQVLLEQGARKVFALDVGHGQLAEDIKKNDRVVDMQGTDARTLRPETIDQQVGAIVVDVSFVSLTKILAPALNLAGDSAWLVSLVKPQFELSPKAIGKGGIVRSEADQQSAIESVCDWIGTQSGWHITRKIPSPITGQSGNQEYLVGATYEASRRST